MHITILNPEDNDPSAVEVLIEDAEGDCFADIVRFYAIVEYESSCGDVTRQIDDYWPEKAIVKDAWINMDGQHEYLTVSNVETGLQAAGFYDQICEKIREAM
jgi:hypothetical protein